MNIKHLSSATCDKESENLILCRLALSSMELCCFSHRIVKYADVNRSKMYQFYEITRIEFTFSFSSLLIVKHIARPNCSSRRFLQLKPQQSNVTLVLIAFATNAFLLLALFCSFFQVTPKTRSSNIERSAELLKRKINLLATSSLSVVLNLTENDTKKRFDESSRFFETLSRTHCIPFALFSRKQNKIIL